MTRRFLGFILMSTLAGLLVSANESVSRASDAANHDNYRIDVKVVPDKGLLEGKMTIRYYNSSANELPTVRFRLDSNLHSKQSLEVIEVKDELGNPLAWSYQPLKFANLSSGKGAMDVKLKHALAPARESAIFISFGAQGNHVTRDLLMLQDDPYQSLDAWYPKAMTPIAEGWSLDDDRLADYDVVVRLPEHCGVASTGKRQGPIADNERDLHLQAEQVRGFTIYASPKWRRHERKSGHVELAVCLPFEADIWSERLLDAAADAIAFYEQEYAPFPSTHLDIACPGSLGDRAHGSSASYNVITIFLGGSLEKQYRFLVPHEVAHQYFSAQVGFPRA